MPNNYELENIQSLYPSYDIQEYIDSGGFKDVFLAKDGSKDIVFKLFPVESRQMRRRAEREARAMEEVESPILVNLIEHFDDEINRRDTYVIVEDYIPGDTLADRIDNSGGDLELGLSVTKSLLEALIDFRDHSLVHRDIKPSNIIITPDGQVTLLDIGIVRFQEEESLTPDHVDRGPSTPPYAAPEVLENNKSAQDVRTDIFSTGIVFYETVAGKHPFDITGMSKPEAIQNAARKEDLGDYINHTELGNQLNEIYLEMTEKQQHERYRKPEFALEELKFVTQGGK